ncbi:unnamed protein product [Fusarium graminearum]|nr:unnamed protein product [Fusarium graminearum]
MTSGRRGYGDIALVVGRLTRGAPSLYIQYWFVILYQVLETLRIFPASAAESIQLSDWTHLARHLGNKDRDDQNSDGVAPDACKVFYPKWDSNDHDPARPAPTEPAPETPRAAGSVPSRPIL